MNGRLMKMELDGNINNKENIEELTEEGLEEIKKNYKFCANLHNLR